MTRKLPAVAGQLNPLLPEEYDEETLEERRAEAFMLSSTGHTQVEIAQLMGCSRSTVQKYIRSALSERRSRLENIDDELERIAGAYEGVALEAWTAFRALRGSTSLAGSNYLRLVLDASKELAHLRGIDGNQISSESGKTEIVVRIGGAAGGGKDAIEVGVRT